MLSALLIKAIALRKATAPLNGRRGEDFARQGRTKSSPLITKGEEESTPKSPFQNAINTFIFTCFSTTGLMLRSMDRINLLDYEELAQAHLDGAAWAYYAGGSDDEVTLRANREAFARIQLRPRVLVDVNRCDTRVTVLGTPISLPVMVAPTAFHSLACPEGECATAQAAGGAGTLMVASSSSTRSLEEIAQAASGPLWFQLYVFNRQAVAELLQRVATAGYRALVLTVDSPRWGQKERAIHSGFQIPTKANFVDQADARDTVSFTLKRYLKLSRR